MNKEQVRRIIALNRQMAQYEAMHKKCVLTEEERDVAMAEAQREIAAIRGQGTLALEQGESAQQKPKKA